MSWERWDDAACAPAGRLNQIGAVWLTHLLVRPDDEDSTLWVNQTGLTEVWRGIYISWRDWIHGSRILSQ